MVPTGIPAYTTPLKLDKAFSIPGWMLPTELLWLAEQASKHSRIVEIGSYLGRSTRALADNTPGFVIAIDDWEGPRDVEEKLKSEALYDSFRDNLDELVTIGIVIPFRAKHESEIMGYGYPAYLSKNQRFDMIFIDGSHEYEDVKRDIAKWLPYLEKGGLMCGHDFAPAYEGVRRAVCEAFAANQLAITDTIWAVIP